MDSIGRACYYATNRKRDVNSTKTVNLSNFYYRRDFSKVGVFYFLFHISY